MRANDYMNLLYLKQSDMNVLGGGDEWVHLMWGIIIHHFIWGLNRLFDPKLGNRRCCMPKKAFARQPGASWQGNAVLTNNTSADIMLSIWLTPLIMGTERMRKSSGEGL